MRPRISRVAQLRCDSIAVSARGRTREGGERARRTEERRKSGGFLLAEGKRRRPPKIYLVAPFSTATVGGEEGAGTWGEDIKYPGIPGTYRAENYK